MNKKQRELLNKILSEQTSGSTEILSSLNNFLLSNIHNKSLLVTSIPEAQKKLSHFAAISNYLKEVNKLLKAKDFASIKKYLSGYEESEQVKYEEIFEKIYKKSPGANSILTISRSGTLIKVFKLWHTTNRNLKIIISESRPANEGKLMAKELLKAGVKVEMITDAMTGMFIPNVGAVVTGADAILKNGNVINKTGSLSLALFCKHYKKPFYVLADKSKYINRTNFKIESVSSESVWKYKHPKLKITNILFEEIYRQLITEIITD